MNGGSFIQGIPGQGFNSWMNQWYLFLALFIVIGVSSALLLRRSSQRPMEWKHNPVFQEYYKPGSLTRLANAVRWMPFYEDDESDVKRLIRVFFSEKVKLRQGLTKVNDLKQLVDESEGVKLMEILQDQEIVDWLLDVKKKSRRKHYFSNLRFILEKMEAWGE
jgi:hypothetical protein